MTQLRLHDRPVRTVFDLLGTKEDDITYSLGWALAQSDDLTYALLYEWFDDEVGELLTIRLQESITGAGRTDIEIETEHAHLIIEAKRGWEVESEGKLATYATRLQSDKARRRAIAVISQASEEWAQPRLQTAIHGIPIGFMPWRTVARHVEQTAAQVRSRNEKNLLHELHRYLMGVMRMRDVESNLVYVVSLSTGAELYDGTSLADVVLKYDSYFHPVGGSRGGWPSEPPNYLGFRFNGRLQQVRHVDSYEVHEAPWNAIHQAFEEEQWGEPGTYFWYRLGPPIVPAHTVRTGSSIQRALRVWAAIDLLLTCDTISEARDKTNERLDAAGEL